MIELIIPWPPTVNHYKRVGKVMNTRTGKVYQQRIDTPATKRFYYEVWVKIASLYPVKRTEMPLQGEIGIYLYLNPPDKRKRDIDNIIKPLFDSLVKGGLLQDDSQITRLLVEKKGIIDGGQVIVQIEELV